MRRVCLLLAAAALAAGIPSARAEAPRIADVPAGIVGLLEDHGRAWTSRDRDLLARTMHAGAFATGRLAAFDNAAALTFDLYRYRASTQFSGEIASARVKALYPGLEVSAYHVIEESRIGGYDLEPYAEDGFFTFARERADAGDAYEGWRLASESDFEALGVFSPTHLWDAGPVRAVTSDHFLVLAHPDLVDQTNAILPVAERAYRKATAFWPRPPGQRYVVMAPSTTSELGDIIQATVDLEKFVAFAAATITTEEGYRPAGVRVFLHMSHFDRYDAEGQEAILAHELIHAVTRPQAGPFVATWIEEGLAMFGSEPENRAAARRADRDRFPTDDEFYVGATADIVTRYRQAQSAVAALAERYQMEGVARFYESLGAARVAPGTQDHHIERSLREALGWSVAEWTEAWRQRIGRP